MNMERPFCKFDKYVKILAQKKIWHNPRTSKASYLAIFLFGDENTYHQAKHTAENYDIWIGIYFPYPYQQHHQSLNSTVSTKISFLHVNTECFQLSFVSILLIKSIHHLPALNCAITLETSFFSLLDLYIIKNEFE